MGDEIRVRCACGWETTGATDDVVAATQEHGRRLHNMEADRTAVLAMAVPLDETPTDETPTDETPTDEAPADEAPANEAPADGAHGLVVADHPEADRYEARLGDRIAAFSVYRRIGDRVVFLHTETDPEFEGRGIGSRLVREALDDVRRRGLYVTAKCPFVSAWLRRHPEYQDLLGRRIGGEPPPVPR